MRFALIVIIAFSVFSVDLYAQKPGRKKSSDEAPNTEKMQGRRDRAGQRRNQQQRFNPRQMFARLDKNQDRVITSDEVPQRLKERMANVDADGNGEINMKEFATAIKKQRDRLQDMLPGQRGSRAKGQGDRAKGGKKGMGKKGNVPSPADMLARLDKNYDQVLSEDEVPERMKKKFSEMDKNGDQQLDEKELISVVERLKAAKESKGNRYDTDPEKSKGKTPKRPPRDG